MPTRSGKSAVVAAILYTLLKTERLPTRVAVVTSRTLLVDDLYRLLKRGLPSVGRLDGHRKVPGQIVVTTYQSLHLLDPQDLLICDEAHRTKGKRFRREMKRHGQRVGFSATPHGASNSDRLPFDELWYNLTYAESVAQGVVIPWEPVWPVGEPVAPGDDGLLDPRRALPEAIRMIEARGGPEAIGPILFTAPNLTVAGWIAEQLRAHGWTAEAAIPRKNGVGHSRRALRALIESFGRGSPQCLVTVDLLAEGVTIPALRAVVLTSAPRGRNHLCQLCGRAMGTCEPDRWGVKDRALIFDPCGVLLSHQLEHAAAMGEALPARPKSAKRAARDGVAELLALPYAVRLTALEDWARAIWSAADRLPRPPGYRQPVPLGMAERRLQATERDQQSLRRWLGLVRYLAGPLLKSYRETAAQRKARHETGDRRAWPVVARARRDDFAKGHREAVRRLTESGAEVPRGVVLDLIAALERVARVRQALMAQGADRVRMAQAVVRLPEGLGLPGEVAGDRAVGK